MSETITENKDCRKCGAAFRPNSQFCYSCGSSVTSDFNEFEKNGNGENDFFTDSSLTQEEEISDFSDTAKAIKKPVGIPLENSAAAPVAAKVKDENKKLVVERETKLKTAASLRQRAKPPAKKTVEIVWEQPEKSSHTWFVLVSLVLVLFAVCMLMAMLHFR